MPKGTPKGAFGPCALAAISALTSRYKLSKRDVKGCIHDLLGLVVSIGTVSNMEQTVSQAVKAPAEEVHEVLKVAPVTNNDETTFYRKHKTTWLWVSANDKFAHFKLQDRRNQAAAKLLLDEKVEHIRIVDRCPSYHYIHQRYRQFCWAHLTRDIQAIIEHAEIRHIAVSKRLEKARKTLFSHYYQLSPVPETEWGIHKQAIFTEIKHFRKALRTGLKLIDTKTGRFCRNIIRDWKCLWHFLRHPDVAPTNNHGERILRHCVLWRKLSHGTQSTRGDRFVERLSTVGKTCRLQGKPCPLS